MISATCGAWIGARSLAGDLPRVRAGRSSGGALCLAAGVGAAVEASAGGALVDPARAVDERLAQPGGVAAGLQDLVGRGWAVDAAIGHPPARRARARPAAAGRAGVRPGDRVEQLLEIGLLVELLELGGARLARARRASASSGSPSGLAVGGCGVGFADDLAVLACRRGERGDVAVGDPDHARVEVVERAQVGLAEDLRPGLGQAGEGAGVDDRVVRARLQVDAGARGRVARDGASAARARGMSASVTAAASARAMKRPRTLVGRVVADAVGLHPRLLEQPPVGRELRVARGELGVVFGDPALGVLGVEGLVQRDAEAAQHRTTLAVSPRSSCARGASSSSESR